MIYRLTVLRDKVKNLRVAGKAEQIEIMGSAQKVHIRVVDNLHDYGRGEVLLSAAKLPIPG